MNFLMHIVLVIVLISAPPLDHDGIDKTVWFERETEYPLLAEKVPRYDLTDQRRSRLHYLWPATSIGRHNIKHPSAGFVSQTERISVNAFSLLEEAVVRIDLVNPTGGGLDHIDVFDPTWIGRVVRDCKASSTNEWRVGRPAPKSLHFIRYPRTDCAYSKEWFVLSSERSLCDLILYYNRFGSVVGFL